MRLAWLVGGAVIGVILTASACSSSRPEPSDDPTGSVTQEIQDGVLDTTHRYAVGICRGSDRQRCIGRCSGALILPNVVATARHCVDDSPEKVDCSSENPSFGARKPGILTVTTNADMFGMGAVDGNGTGWYSVKQIAVPTDNHMCGNDIALLVLNKMVPAAEAKPVTPGVQYLMWDPAAQYSMSFTAIGFGQTSPTGPSGRRYRRELMRVICVPGSPTRDCPAETKIPEKEFVGSDGICSGDSGSSAYEARSYDRDEPVSFGVLSRGGEQDGKCVGSVYTRFDAHRDFVVEVAKIASNDWTLYPEPSWTEPKPPPSKEPPKTKPDAGEPAPETGRLEIGEECTESSQCRTNKCADTGDGTMICTRLCIAQSSSTCPEGYECRDSLCLPALDETPAPAAAPTITKTTTSCSVGRTSSTSGGWAGVALAVAASAALRRRRRD